MYYPYLRARQFELIAIRELAIEGLSQNHVLPIFEPVKDSSNNLRLANKIFAEHSQSAYLIFNPLVGELKDKTEQIVTFFNDLENNSFIPAFHYRNNSTEILDCVESNNLENCLMICESETSSEDVDFRALMKTDYFNTVSIENPDGNRSLKRFLFDQAKEVVRFDDFFEKQPRNSNFLEIQEHRYSEEHIYFSEEGYYGFSDYTVVPSEFVTGGSTPLAVVIHLTFLKENNQIWIRHFTSNSNETIANVQGKFAEAAHKAVSFCRANNLTNSAISDLENFYDNQHYPGLGTVKKIAIKNHILVISNYLDSNS